MPMLPCKIIEAAALDEIQLKFYFEISTAIINTLDFFLIENCNCKTLKVYKYADTNMSLKKSGVSKCNCKTLCIISRSNTVHFGGSISSGIN